MEITKSIFREYDIRGEYPNQINEEVVRKIGNAIAGKCINLDIKEICVGRDGRNSGKSLLEAMIGGLSESGIEVINIDLATSPLLYYAAKKNKYKSGIMITGSHNPKNHNGIKLIIDDKPVSGSEILDLIISKDFKFSESVGSTKSLNVKDNYIEEVSQSLKINKKLKIVIDCGNGAAGFVAPDLYKKLGCEVIELYSDVDGDFPNHHPDPGKVENLKDLTQAVKAHDADLGLAFDGDGDRVGMVTNNGEIVFPDKILMMLSKDVLHSQKGSIIFDVKCSNALSQIIKENGGSPIMSPTGHFHIKNGIKKYNPLLAGEMSGHIFFNDRWYGFDDGHYTGARIIEMLSNTEKSISEICSDLPILFSTPELNINVTDENKFKIIKEFADNCRLEGKKNTIDGLRLDFEDGWGLIRASNTTPKLVLRFEGKSEEILKRIQNDFLNELTRICPDIDINLS